MPPTRPPPWLWPSPRWSKAATNRSAQGPLSVATRVCMVAGTPAVTTTAIQVRRQPCCRSKGCRRRPHQRGWGQWQGDHDRPSRQDDVHLTLQVGDCRQCIDDARGPRHCYA
jgi:hypothetical protein